MPWGSAACHCSKTGPIAQISFGSSPSCSGGATFQPSVIALGAPQFGGDALRAGTGNRAAPRASSAIHRMAMLLPFSADRC